MYRIRHILYRDHDHCHVILQGPQSEWPTLQVGKELPHVLEELKAYQECPSPHKV